LKVALNTIDHNQTTSPHNKCLIFLQEVVEYRGRHLGIPGQGHRVLPARAILQKEGHRMYQDVCRPTCFCRRHVL